MSGARWRAAAVLAAALAAALCFAARAAAWGGAPPDAVDLRTVTVLTLRSDAQSTARRGAPVPQLRCANCADDARLLPLRPRVAQCLNRGVDDTGAVQWRCEAELDKRVAFGALDVSCEGYASRDDPMVLRGSCGLEYELLWTSAPPAASPSSPPTAASASASRGSYFAETSSDRTTSILTIVAVAALLLVGYALCCRGAAGGHARMPRAAYGAPVAGGAYDPRPAGLPGYSSLPAGGLFGTSEGGGLGTTLGAAAVGAMAGYAAGRAAGAHNTVLNQGPQPVQHVPEPARAPEAPAGSRTAAGFATTKRR